MKAYIYKADIYCEDCGKMIIQGLPESRIAWPKDMLGDSDWFPQGPYDSGGGEADSPQHCGSCGVFLENGLTNDGDAYVRMVAKEFETGADNETWEDVAHAAEIVGRHDLAQWIRFYYAYGQ